MVGHWSGLEEKRHGFEDGNRRPGELAMRDFWYVLTSRHRTPILHSVTLAGGVEDVEQFELQKRLTAIILHVWCV